MKINCQLCGKEKKVKPANLKIGKGKYCSISCASKARKHSLETKLKMSNAHRGKPHPWNKGIPLKLSTKIKLSQSHKGKKFSDDHKLNISKARMGIKFSKNHIENIRKVNALKKKTMKGDKCWRWKGGITPIKKQIRESYKYKEWRHKCFLKDNFTCQKCEIQGGDLEVHHKKPFIKLSNEAINYMPLFSKYEACMYYPPLWNINNGMTLCRKCHNKTKRAISKKTQI